MNRIARRRIRPRRSIVLSAGFVLVAGFFILFVLVSMTPDLYRPLASSTTASERARIFERSFATEITRIRDSEANWGIRIREEDLNAWLWLRLPEWLSHMSQDGEVEFPRVQSMIESNQILVTSPRGVLAFEPQITSKGLLLHPRSGGSLGLLPVPSSLLLFFSTGFDFDRILSSFGGLDSGGNALPCRFSLGDGRVVEVLETRLNDGELVLVLKTRNPGFSNNR